MFFRNLTFFRYPAVLGFDALGAGLDECQLRPVGPLEISTRGFVSPYGRDSEVLAARQAGAIWLTVGSEERILPSAALNELLARKLDEIERKEGQRPGGRTRKRLRDQLVTELLPKALVRPGRLDALVLPELGLVAVDTSSRGKAENVASEIRRALGSFPALPLNAEVAPRSVLTGWVAGGEMPEGLVIGEECELRDPVDQGAVVKVQRMDLHSDEIARHLESGKQVTRLALTLQDRVSFILGEDLVVRKFKLLEGAVDELESTDVDDVRAELDARMVLMVAEVRSLFGVLATALKVSEAE